MPKLITATMESLSLEDIFDTCQARDADARQECAALWDKLKPLCHPKALYTQVPVDWNDDILRVGGHTITSIVVRKNFADSPLVWPYVATCGRELYEYATTLTDPLEQFWADKIQVAALGQALKALHAEFFAAHNGGEPMASVNPGSLPDWPLPQQQMVFDLLGDVEGQVGVTLCDSFLMVPIKSVSGIFFKSEIGFVNCMLCTRETCPNRRAPYDEMFRAQHFDLIAGCS